MTSIARQSLYGTMILLEREVRKAFPDLLSWDIQPSRFYYNTMDIVMIFSEHPNITIQIDSYQLRSSDVRNTVDIIKSEVDKRRPKEEQKIEEPRKQMIKRIGRKLKI